MKKAAAGQRQKGTELLVKQRRGEENWNGFVSVPSHF